MKEKVRFLMVGENEELKRLATLLQQRSDDIEITALKNGDAPDKIVKEAPFDVVVVEFSNKNEFGAWEEIISMFDDQPGTVTSVLVRTSVESAEAYGRGAKLALFNPVSPRALENLWKVIQAEK